MAQTGALTVASPRVSRVEKTGMKFTRCHVNQGATDTSGLVSVPHKSRTPTRPGLRHPRRVCAPQRLRTPSSRVGGQSAKVFTAKAFTESVPPLLLSHSLVQLKGSRGEALTLSPRKSHSSVWQGLSHIPQSLC